MRGVLVLGWIPLLVSCWYRCGIGCVCRGGNTRRGHGVGTVERIDELDAQIVGDLHVGLRRFTAVAAPWDLDPDDVLHAAVVGVLKSRRLSTLDDPGAYLRRTITNRPNNCMKRRETTSRATTTHSSGISDNEMANYPSDLANP